MKISIIVAVSENNVIGKDGSIPWHIPQDLKHFKDLTMGHHVIMGRKTHESIGKPLPGRTNIILSRDLTYKSEGAITVESIDEAISLARSQNDSEIFIIGGEEIFKLALPYADRIYLTNVHGKFGGDAFFPKLDPIKWQQVSCEVHLRDQQNPYPFDFCTYEKKF